MSRSGSGIAGETFSLVCSVTLRTVPLPSNAPAPTFKWLYGSNSMSEELPSGVTPMQTVQGSGNTYISTLQFSLLNQSYSGIYTCRLGAGRLANNTTVSVIGMCTIIQHVIVSALLPLYSLVHYKNNGQFDQPQITRLPESHDSSRLSLIWMEL